ncbi:MAG: DUF1080 domain-containing protein [Bryobacteraceae bacterium]|nr:DUF1080 domain-containing protein [Bryobacteraceae bacterium]
MPSTLMDRRAFAASLAAPLLAAQSEDWVELFNGTSLDGWKPNENPASWRVEGGAIVADGPRSHLFYAGNVRSASFRNFELEVEAMAAPGANSGVYFHTAFQPEGWPLKGFEVQINNTATGEGNYRENKKTGSLYGVRNLYRQFVSDNEWFTLNVLVRNRNVQVRLNGMLAVDYTEPLPPPPYPGMEKERRIGAGTFALQCHDPGSKVRFRRIRVRPLPDAMPLPAGAVEPVADADWREILALGAQNYPMADFHVHLKGGLTLQQALDRSRLDGIFYGIAVNCGKGHEVENDEAALRFFERMKGQPCFIAMQAEGREWMQMFSRRVASMFDYVFTDSMTWTDNRGRRMRTWIPAEVGAIADAQEFMDTLVARTVEIIEKEPIDLYVNPTYIPDQLQPRYDELWTEERMKKVLSALARNEVAMEINDRYGIPSAKFIRMGKEMGVKFAFGTNNAGPKDLRRCDYGRRMVRECRLGWSDFWTPPPAGRRAVDRKGAALRAA